MTYSKSEFLANTLILNTRYEYLGSQNNNVFYLFRHQLNYALAHYYVKSEIIKCNIDKFFSNPLIKPITKKLSYCNTNE